MQPSLSDAPGVKPWRPSTLISASLAWHGIALLGSLARPSLWPWALGTLIADHLLLTGAGLWPRSALLGPNWTRLPSEAASRREIAITIDDGPDPEVTPRVLSLLDAYGARATFFCIGARVQEHPQLAREIVARGHDIENHSQRHRHTFSLLGPRGIRAEVEAAQESIAWATGRRPRFFRAPAGLRNPFLEPVLARLGLTLASWTRRGFDTVNRRPGRILARLTHHLSPRDILLLHDGGAARTASGEPVILEVLPPLLTAIRAARLTPVTLSTALT
jgi:peptidoglycan/xylan/chitin deacetylase (PgdA/CDA1 family)